MPIQKRTATKGAKRLPIAFSAAQLLYVLLLVAIFLLGYFFARVQSFEKRNGTTTQVGNPSGQVGARQGAQGKVDVANGHLLVAGKNSAKVTVIEFSDFQCPFCRRFFVDTLGQIKKDYIDTGKVKLYYRHFPLSFHPQAQMTAEASECANEQGKFWEFHDKVFEEQEKQGPGTITYTVDDVKRWAAETGLNTSTFNPCVDTNKYKEKVTKDQADGQKAGVSGTPTFYINGTQLVGAQPFSAFKAAIDAVLVQK